MSEIEIDVEDSWEQWAEIIDDHERSRGQLVTLGRGGHARLAPSSSGRWIPCPGSLYYPDGPDSEAAERGTHSHKVLELCLIGMPPEVGTTLAETGRVVEQGHLDQAFEIIAYLDETYPDYQRTSEERVKLEGSWLEEIQGTLDISLVRGNHLVIIDAKFGFIQVEPEGNSQLILYAKGKLSPGIERITLIIAQPDFNGLMVFKVAPELYRADINQWVFDNLLRIENAALGSRELQAGKHCRWCTGRPSCPAYLAAYNDFIAAEWVLETDFDTMLKQADAVEAAIKALRAEAFKRLMEGKKVPGKKLVAKRGRIHFTEDESDVTRQLMAAGPDDLEELDLYDIKLKSWNKLAKMLGKKNIKGIPTNKVSSGVTMVDDTDPRPAVNHNDFTLEDGERAALGLTLEDSGVDEAPEEME